MVKVSDVIAAYEAKKDRLGEAFPVPTGATVDICEALKVRLRDAGLQDDEQLAVAVLHARTDAGLNVFSIGFSGFPYGEKLKLIRDTINFRTLLRDANAPPGLCRILWETREKQPASTWCAEPKAYGALRDYGEARVVLGFACFWFSTYVTSLHRIEAPGVPITESYMLPCPTCKTNGAVMKGTRLEVSAPREEVVTFIYDPGKFPALGGERK